jgi:hypothetical protein
LSNGHDSHAATTISDQAAGRPPPGGDPFGNAVIIGGAIVLAGLGATFLQYLSNFGIVGWVAIGIAVAVSGLALIATYIERRCRWARNQRADPRYARLPSHATVGTTSAKHTAILGQESSSDEPPTTHVPPSASDSPSPPAPPPPPSRLIAGVGGYALLLGALILAANIAESSSSPPPTTIAPESPSAPSTISLPQGKPSSSAQSAHHAAHADFYRQDGQFVLSDDRGDGKSAILELRINGTVTGSYYNYQGETGEIFDRKTGFTKYNPPKVFKPLGLPPDGLIEFRVCVGKAGDNEIPQDSCGPWAPDLPAFR